MSSTAVNAPSRSAGRGTPRIGLLVLAYLAFVSLGLPDGLIGVGWPSIRSELGEPTEAVGFILTGMTAGYLTSSVAAGFTIARLGVGWLLAGSTALASLALTGYALSPALPVMVASAVLLGLGSGAVDSGLNAYAASSFSPRHMNWLHAFFGLGVTFGPLIMTAAISANLTWRGGYALVAAAQMALAAAFALTVRAWGPRAGRDEANGDQAGVEERPRARIRHLLALPSLWSGLLTFAMYTSVEVGAGLWAFLLLTEGRGLSVAVAGPCVSGYWGSLFVGRVIQGIMAERLGSRKVLVASLLGMLVGSVLLAGPAPAWLAVVGLALLGFSAAPVFPLLTLTTSERVGAGQADRAIGMQIGSAGLAGALIPAGIGLLLVRIDIEALGPALAVLCLIMVGAYVVSIRCARPPQRPTDQCGPLRPVVDGR